MAIQREATSSRILAPDIARFYAMALVFYGHFIERVMYLHNPTAAMQYKFIYSFHMVAFIILAGYILNRQIQFLDPLKGRVVGWNYLFIHEAITMYAFYLIGIYMRHKEFFIKKVPLKIGLPAAAAAFVLVRFTYNLNSGHFTFKPLDAVVIMMASHGQFLWFPFTAIIGSLLLLFLASATPAQKTILWMGRNTLLLMCLNGIFYHYVNPRAAVWITKAFPVGPWSLTGIAVLVTVGSMALCAPLMLLFNRFVPELVGKPYARRGLPGRLAVNAGK